MTTQEYYSRMESIFIINPLTPIKAKELLSALACVGALSETEAVTGTVVTILASLATGALSQTWLDALSSLNKDNALEPWLR